MLLEVARALAALQAPDEQQILTDVGISVDELNAAWHALREGDHLRWLGEKVVAAR
ncbi:hypothetical protein GCM10023340_26480 [Nocardioides marinquilinus]|uniref:Uncharacterized protein n=1 Tax=Nocardioides marinquilinus TaxID=1210400 RepID=A0ABP9PPR8_9ACTN